MQKKKAVTSDDVEIVEVRKLVEKRNIPNILNLEDGEFLKESGCFLLGRKIKVAVSTTRRVNSLGMQYFSMKALLIGGWMSLVGVTDTP